MKKHPLLGYCELSFAQFCIGANIISGKLLVSHFPIYSLLFFRFLIGFLIAGVCVLATSRQQTVQEYKKLSTRDWLLIFLQALCGGFLFNICVLYGLQYTTATVTGIINSAVPALVAVFSFFILKERLNRNKAVAIVLCIVGIGILSLGKAEGPGASNNDLFGIFLILLAIVPEAMFTIFAKLLRNPLSPMATTVLVNFFNAVLFIPFLFYSETLINASLSVSVFMQLLLYGLSGGILFFVFWYRGLKQVSANTAALFMGVMPIATTLLAVLFLSESLNIYDGIGMLCVLTSIFFGTRERSPSHKSSEAALASDLASP